MPTLTAYFRREDPHLTREQVAAAAGVSTATLARRDHDGHHAGEVIAAARALGWSPIGALVDLGLLDAADVAHAVAVANLPTVPDSVLLEELARRAALRDGA